MSWKGWFVGIGIKTKCPHHLWFMFLKVSFNLQGSPHRLSPTATQMCCDTLVVCPMEFLTVSTSCLLFALGFNLLLLPWFPTLLCPGTSGELEKITDTHAKSSLNWSGTRPGDQDFLKNSPWGSNMQSRRRTTLCLLYRLVF